MWRRVFHLLSAFSLVMLVVSAGLWARSSTHHEQLRTSYSRWAADDDLQHYGAVAHWNYGSIELIYARLSLPPSYFEVHGQETRDRALVWYPPGMKWDFSGDDVTMLFGSAPHGYKADYWQSAEQRRWTLGTRLWLPTILFAVLPATWFIDRQRRKEKPWQFSLRALSVLTTVACILLAAVIWLRA